MAVILVGLVLAFLATVRVTRFLNSDALAEGIRIRVQSWFGVDSPQAYLIECPWCASIWIAPLPAVLLVGLPLALMVGAPWWYAAAATVAAALGCSWLTGIAASRLDNDD